MLFLTFDFAGASFDRAIGLLSPVGNKGAKYRRNIKANIKKVTFIARTCDFVLNSRMGTTEERVAVAKMIA
jgi:hypothetical protein